MGRNPGVGTVVALTGWSRSRGFVIDRVADMNGVLLLAYWLSHTVGSIFAFDILELLVTS